MSVVSLVVAVCVFVLALVWAAVGVAGLRGTLRRNRWLGVRSTETLASEEAFRLANRVAAPGTLGAAVILVAGGLLTLGVEGTWRFLFGLGALIAALVVVGVVSGYGVRASRWATDADSDAGCGCCSGAHSHDSAPDSGPAADPGPAAAADCGESSCASCTLRGVCAADGAGSPGTRDAAQA
ncbi:SdpI family protein [Gordonia sp. DT30]|uniref:SdpI family protein n=1 Tax=unclassified Gordonia (in: high G+C Gram-positive bacteria) TaxID=2657482 RepID=UPI003CE67A96